MTDHTRIALASRPQGAPTLENFRLETAALRDPGPGEVLVRVLWLSLDPYMRGRMDDVKSYAGKVELGDTMEGGGVGEVVASNSKHYAPGDIVVGRTGWASHAVLSETEMRKVDPELAPISTALGVLGMPGHTAWVGLNDILAAQEGETIVVSAATGAVGSLVGQLAKRKNMKVIGVAGGAEKCAYAVEHLGYEACIDHRSPDLAAELKALTPGGVDCYYENVGGATLEAVLPLMNDFSRIAICGMIAWYSGKGLEDAMRLPKMWRSILVKRMRVQGFIIFDHNDRFAPFAREVGPLVKSGEIHYRESVADGLENAPAAFLELLGGGNFGKQLVKVADKS
ncbi:putative oxidoreductase YncB [Candidatus Rhodobacter oscarellae]|uniref:Putative oxidoreductase YncB n=1 Tax=Candidatus Rhodobacter oscarellae TaxID=1675527 RepID=A0A0J9E4U1_9RHOB|nr:NADP-dependent oxidoreductase [Candidatus Rhodobacter lobularis]KMW57762.1 putative oxidoreductase YncB [Candidatus Rhodobacter lobularis]